MTHKELIPIAYKWVLNNASCGVAFRELYNATCNGEYADVIGFGSGRSVLIEVKASRSDFLSDKKKPFRKEPAYGMGQFRFYLCPKDMIKIDELPVKWGLIYVDEKGKARCVYNPYKKNPYSGKGNIWDNPHERNIKAEHSLMYSALRRLHKRGRIEEIYEPERPR